MNARARRFGAPGIITATDLGRALMREGWVCGYCGIQLEKGSHGFDHMVPLKMRGPNRQENIVPTCSECNRQKFTKTPEELREFQKLRVSCRVCGKEYRPRWAEWKNGRARTCSLSCAATLARR